VLAFGCGNTDSPTAPEAPPPPSAEITSPTTSFAWTASTPESQGMCGSTKQLGCTKTLLEVWNGINATKYNTKRFLVIRNDKVIYDRGGTLAYAVYSANKGLLGAPALVHAMSKCGVGLTEPAYQWLAHGEGARWASDYPWSNITVEQLASHTAGVCDYGNSSTVCRDENPGWQLAYDHADLGGTKYLYPGDAFTIARTKAEQNRSPALPPGSVFEYSNVSHGLMNYVVQKACGQKLVDIYDSYIRRAGMGSPLGAAQIYTDDNKLFNQSSGVARWNGRDGAAVLRLAGRLGIWDNENVEPVRYWRAVTKTVGNIAAAAAEGFGVVYENNSTDRWTQSLNHRRLSPEMFGHGGNYSTLFLNDPLTSTIIVRQGQGNATGASYLTQNGCFAGWTGTSPTCTAGSDWTNNWGVSTKVSNWPDVGPRKKVVEPLQEAFFFPPPFCRMISVAGQPLDDVTDVYNTPPDATSIDLVAEIQVNPREGAGSSVADKVQFYKEGGAGAPEYIGDGAVVPGTSPARYQLSYSAESHGEAGEIRTYFANCVAKSTIKAAKKVPSYSRPVRLQR
jgi:CubicO group peptidase (beta-lactamase class C family)